MVRISGFRCCGQVSVPGQGNEILQASRHDQKKFLMKIKISLKKRKRNKQSSSDPVKILSAHIRLGKRNLTSLEIFRRQIKMS